MQNRPVRIFEGTAQPHEPFWLVRDANPGADPEMEFYGYISEYSWFEDDITPKKFKDDLNRVGNGGPVTLRMNSGGGDVIAASVIRSIIQEYTGKVTVIIDGLAASAATIVAMAGDVVRMQESAYFMIHDPSTIGFGNIDELSRLLDMLKTIKDGIIDAYESRTGMNRDRLSRMMNNETWLTAREAMDFGFVDEVITASKKAKIAPVFTNYVNVPAVLLARSSEPEYDQQAADKLRAEVKILV